jgi:ribosomal protein L33
MVDFDTSKLNLPKEKGDNLDKPDGLSNAGRGRALGSTNIASRRATKKLEQMGYDPIERMIELHQELVQQIYDMTHDEDGFPTKKYSQMAYAQLLTIKQRCVSELMRYGYARVSEGVEISTKAIAPITIQLADNNSNFDTSQVGQLPNDDDEAPFRGDDE